MSAEHTPTPWKQHDGFMYMIIDKNKKSSIAETKGNNCLANAKFICLAANNHDALVELISDALKNMEHPAVQCQGDWQKGMFCGLEDMNITDRYEACMFGYNKALEKVEEWVLRGFEEILAKIEEEK